MDVDQNKFGGPIVLTALVLGKPVGATINPFVFHLERLKSLISKYQKN